MPLKRGVAVWISGFLTFLAALSSFSIVMYWIREDRNFILRPYLVGDIIRNLVGDLRVETYFWISIVTTFVFFGLTCLIAYRKLPPDPEIVKMFVKVGGNLASVRKTVETTKTELAESLENNRATNEKFFREANTNFEKSKKETLDTLEKQGKVIQKVRQDLVSVVETKVDETRREMLGLLEKQRTTIQEVGRLTTQSGAAIKKQRAELEDMGKRLEKIEGELAPPQPRLKSKDNPEEIRGIGPRLGEELRSIGITNIGELITADPTVIDEKTRVSREMAERLQAMAQLLMVPSVDENDAELLVEAGVFSRRKLADQDLVSLSRKIGEVTKIYLEKGKFSEDEKPTIEEISSWIKMAK